MSIQSSVENIEARMSTASAARTLDDATVASACIIATEVLARASLRAITDRKFADGLVLGALAIPFGLVAFGTGSAAIRGAKEIITGQ